MKEFRGNDAAWIERLPVWAPGLFPGSRSHHRAHVEGGFAPSKEVTPEARWFNAMMCENTAAFADIIGSYTRTLYGRERLIAIFKILSRAWQRCTDYGYGTRAWMHLVCQEAMA